MERAVWKVIACPASDGFYINHFFKEERMDGGMMLKSMVRRAREKWQMMSAQEQQFFKNVPFYPALGECMAF